MGSQAGGYKRKAPVALAGAFKSGPLAAGETEVNPAWDHVHDGLFGMLTYIAQ